MVGGGAAASTHGVALLPASGRHYQIGERPLVGSTGVGADRWSARLYRVCPNTSSITNWLPKNASSSNSIAASVQCTAFMPRQP